MLKLKVATASLALAGMILLILGDTYMSAALAVVCTAVALPMGGISRMEISHSGRSLLGPFRSMGTGS